MGGRGAASGTSIKGNTYGTQYTTILTSGNIKSVIPKHKDSETLMETMTDGRVYVRVSNNELHSIIYFDNDNKRIKQIDLRHEHKGIKPHVHHGYYHDEYSKAKNKATAPDTKERAMVDKVYSIWEHYIKKQ